LFLDPSESDDAVEIVPSPRASSSRHPKPKSRKRQKESVDQMMRLSPPSQTVRPTSPRPQVGRHSVSNPKIPRNKTINDAENSEEDEEFAELDAWLQSGCVSIL
jgi:hypothetical protein